LNAALSPFPYTCPPREVVIRNTHMRDRTARKLMFYRGTIIRSSEHPNVNILRQVGSHVPSNPGFRALSWLTSVSRQENFQTFPVQRRSLQRCRKFSRG